MLDLSAEDITEGPLLRALLVLAAPLLVQNVVQVAQQVIDLFWVGRLSGEAVAAIGLVFPITALLFAIVVFAPFVGTQVLVSQRIGRGDTEAARRATFTGLAVGFGLAVVFGVGTFLVAQPIVDLMTATLPDEARGAVPRLGVAYLGVIALGLPMMVLGDSLEAAYVGWGDSQASLYMNVMAVGLNLILDPLLIFGIGPFPRLGIQGAALATVIGGFGGAILGFMLVARGRNDGMVSWTAAVFRVDEAVELLDIGLPTTGQRIAHQTARLVLVVLVFTVGGAAGLAAYSVGIRVAAIAVVPAVGLQQAAQSIVGQNLGAAKPDRADRATWLGVAVAGCGLGIVGAGQWFLPGLLTDLVVPSLEADARALSIDFLRILAYGYPAIGAAYLLQAGFNGARRTRTSFMASLIQYWGVRVTIAAGGVIWLGYGVGLVFWAVTISNIAVAVGLAAYTRREAAGGMFVRAAEHAADSAPAGGAAPERE